MKKRINRYSVEDQMNRFGLTKEEAEEKIKNFLDKGRNKWNIYSVEDQMKNCNISKEEAEEKILNMKKVNVFNIEWQMKKFNLSKEEAEEKIISIKNNIRESQLKMSDFDFNSMIPSKKEHWIKKGLSEEESLNMVNKNIKIAKNNCSKFINDIRENPSKYIGRFDTSIEYYLKLGYTEDESKRLLKKRQTTFSLELCIEKYGLEVGISRWNERQNKWAKSIQGKITNEMKDSYSFSHFLKKNNNDYESAKLDHENTFEKRYLSSKFGKDSKTSMKIFTHLSNICDSNSIPFYCGVDNKREYFIRDITSNKIYAYDFTIPSLNLIFEYHESFWHSKIMTDKFNSLGVSLSDTYKKDQLKKDLAKRNEFNLIELFEEDGFEFNLRMSIDILMNSIR